MNTSTVTSWMFSDALSSPNSPTVADVAYFRLRTELPDPLTAAVPITITADSRYRLSINGQLVAAGPAKPSAGVWFLDTVDIGPHLRPGVNVIAVELLWYAVNTTGNASVLRTGSPGLSMAGVLPDGTDLSDASSWRWTPVLARRFRQGINTVFLGIQEDTNGHLLPHGWQLADYDDTGWQVPSSDDEQDFLDRVQRPRAVARPIPALTLQPGRFTAVSTTADPDIDWAGFIAGYGVQIGPNRTVQVDLDFGELTTAYLAVHLVGGAGATLQLTAAECYEHPPVEIPWRRRKGLRTDAVNGDLYGDPDTYEIAGTGVVEQPELFAPYWFRTFRYVRLRITTADDAVLLSAMQVTTTRYPLAVMGSFASSAESDRLLWDTSVRTLLNCMHETFEDCPFYEQLQYAMDTRSQALFTLQLSTDDRLIRRAIEDFAASGDPSGLTESRTPCVQQQFIPGFSLFWVFMVADHLDYVGDRDFTRRFIARIDAVLGYFDRSLSDDGFVLSPPEDHHVWNFVDWTTQWTDSRGVPDLGARRANTIATFMYIAALRSAAGIADHCGRAALAGEYRHRATELTDRITTSAAFDPATGLFRDSDTGAPRSQHAQVWAVLSEAVTGPPATDLLRRALADPTLAVCSYAMSMSLFQALRAAGLDELIDWQPWHDMLGLNLTTWAEDTVSNRSDCHAWGSVALHQFPRYVLGVAPTRPGFDGAIIDPAPSELSFAHGLIPTRHGPIETGWEKTGPNQRRVWARLPADIAVDLPALASDVTDQVVAGTRDLSFTHRHPSTEPMLPREKVSQSR